MGDDYNKPSCRLNYNFIQSSFASGGCNIVVCDINREILAATRDNFHKAEHELYTAQLAVCDNAAVFDFASDIATKFGSLDV